MTELVAALTLGLAGSVHCVAMCGPLILAWRPVRGPARVALYHVSRVSVYAVAGLLAGVAGQVVSLAGLGRVLSIGVGLVLVAIAGRRMGLGFGTTGGAGLVGRLLGRTMRAVRSQIDRRPVAGVMAAGALNGLVPCGLVYAALAAAATLGSASRAIAFMLAFGLGTIAPLAAISLLAESTPQSMRARVRVAAPLALVLLGLLLITRGTMTSTSTASPGQISHHLHLH
jgi:uncharacterized protein